MAFARTFLPVLVILGIEIITAVIVSIGVAPTVTKSVTTSTSTLAYATGSFLGNAETTDLGEMAGLSAIVATRFIAARVATSKSTTSSASEITTTSTARDADSIVRFLAPAISIVPIGTIPVALANVIGVLVSFKRS